MIYLSVEDALGIHDRQLAEDIGGGLRGVRSIDLLASAMAQPEATAFGVDIHSTLFAKAAAYAFHITKNHPFADGNKRAALAIAAVFLDLNGYRIDARDETLTAAMLDVSEGKLGREDLAKLFADHTSEQHT